MLQIGRRKNSLHIRFFNSLFLDLAKTFYNTTTMSPNIELPPIKAFVSGAAALANGLAKEFMLNQVRSHALNTVQHIVTGLSNKVILVIDEFDGVEKEELFSAAVLYASTIPSPSTKRFRASVPGKEEDIRVSLGGNEEITDKSCGFPVKWRLFVKSDRPKGFPDWLDDYGSSVTSEGRRLELTFHKKHKDMVLSEYLPFIMRRSKEIREKERPLKLHTVQKGLMLGWQSVNLDHPANFNTLAMDDEKKKEIVDDLDMFLRRKELYKKVGKPWKRGYLLYGPPGTGKSSLIAAMANHLKFDVYDLELTAVASNSTLKRLLLSTANRSILVVEDIDASSIDLSPREKEAGRPPPPMHPFHDNQGSKVTLSGLLNVIDGLWSSCGDERIIIFTTNHKDKLDPALLREGRMDMHIHMSYCSPHGFKTLASNYLGITEHPLVLEAGELLATSKVTPAEVGEQLLKSDDPELALRGLIEFIQRKKEEETGKRKTATSPDRLKELIVTAKASLGEMKDEIAARDEAAAKAVKILFGYFDKRIGAGDVKDSDAGGSSSATTPAESGKGDGINHA